MSASTVPTGVHSPGKAAKPAPHWPTILMWTALLALLIIAIWMRLIGLGLPFDRDGYDEGVYWQSLMAMRAGNSLYGQIFYSQPPFFLLSTYPFYILFGGSLWSARLGIALVSLVGLVGAFLLGKAIRGRLGAVLATLLVVADPLYLSLSQKIEAEVSSTAFSLLAVGAAYMWWESAEGTAGLVMAVLCGIALPLGIFCKLLGLTAVAPVGLLVLARLWQYWQKRPGVTIRSVRTILVAVGTCIVVILLVVMPFLGSYTRLVQDVISFHTQARAALINNQVNNIHTFKSFLIGTWPLVLAAAFGLLTSLILLDWRVLPLLAWLLLTMFMLWLEVPLFYRHFIALLPALIGLAVLGMGNLATMTNITKMTEKGSLKRFFASLKVDHIVTALAVVLMLVTVGLDAPQYRPYYQAANRQGSDANTKLEIRVAHDLDSVLTPQQYVLTDGQFVAALANRNTPPSMVDTSMVRISGGYLTQQQLIDAASQPNVEAVLFFTSRLTLPKVAGFYTWVKHHYHLKYRYGPGRELWVK